MSPDKDALHYAAERGEWGKTICVVGGGKGESVHDVPFEWAKQEGCRLPPYDSLQ